MKTTTVKNPNQSGKGFAIAVGVVVIIAALVIGYVFMQGRDSKTNVADKYGSTSANFSVEFADNAVTLRGANATSDTPQVDLYEDYSCPHCSELAEASDEAMKQAIEEGKLVVNIRTLNFLDRGNNDGHSNRAGTAALLVAESGNADQYWALRTMLMEQQSSIYGKWSMDDFANAAHKLGVSDDVVNQIKSNSDHQEMLSVAEANSAKLKAVPPQNAVSSPRVIHDGKDVELGNKAQMGEWVNKVINS